MAGLFADKYKAKVSKKNIDKVLYFTGSRFYYGKNSNQVSNDTDFDFFGSNEAVAYWKDKLVEDGYKESPAGYFNRSYYLEKEDSGITINLISLNPTDIDLWLLSTVTVKLLISNNIISNGNYSIKNMYIPIFQMLQIIAKPFKRFINSDGIIKDMIMFSDMYPEIIELKDAMSPTTKMPW